MAVRLVPGVCDREVSRRQCWLDPKACLTQSTMQSDEAVHAFTRCTKIHATNADASFFTVFNDEVLLAVVVSPYIFELSDEIYRR